MWWPNTTTVPLVKLAQGGRRSPSRPITLNKSTNPTKIMFEELWNEIQDSPGEIFDITDLQEEEEKFDFDGYLAADYHF